MSQKICIFAPANFYLIMIQFKKQISSFVIGTLAIAGMLSSCWDNNESETVVTNYNNALVTKVSMNNNNNVCKDLSSYGFTIDQLGTSDETLTENCRKLWSVDEYSLLPGIIFNPDSLPVGSEADSIKLSITATYAYKVEIFQYDKDLHLKNYTNFKDTQIVWFDDYAVTRIQVTASNRLTNKSYFLKINTHQCMTDTIRWKYLTKDLFDMTEVVDQRVDTIGTNLYWYTSLSDGSQQVRRADLLGNVAEWSDPVTVVSPAPVDLNTLLNWQDKIYGVGTNGLLLSTTDGTSWTTASSDYTFVSILGIQLAAKEYDEHLCAIATIDGKSQFVRSDNGTSWSIDSLIIGSDTTSVVPDNFPVTGFTRPISVAADIRKGKTTSRIYISGGVLADGSLTASTWSSDGFQWAEFAQTQMPAMRRASIIRYTLDQDHPDTFWIMQTGEMAGGHVSDTLYYSENSGVTWKKLYREHLKLGDTYEIDPFGCSSAFFNPQSYRIYFIGGKNNEGKQESNIVTGALPNLSMLKKR